jgi:hypothetical protein
MDTFTGQCAPGLLTCKPQGSASAGGKGLTGCPGQSAGPKLLRRPGPLEIPQAGRRGSTMPGARAGHSCGRKRPRVPAAGHCNAARRARTIPRAVPSSGGAPRALPPGEVLGNHYRRALPSRGKTRRRRGGPSGPTSLLFQPGASPGQWEAGAAALPRRPRRARATRRESITIGTVSVDRSGQRRSYSLKPKWAAITLLACGVGDLVCAIPFVIAAPCLWIAVGVTAAG